MAVVRTVEDISQYEGDPAGWTEGRGVTHYTIPFVEGLTGDAIEAAVLADTTLPDACSVRYLVDTDELRITFQVDDTPEEGDPPPPPGEGPLAVITDLVDDLLDLL